MTRLLVLDEDGNQSRFTNPIVGIHGLMETGKTELATRLQTHLHKHLIRSCLAPMAHPLKKIARDMGWNGKKDAKGRRLLQLLGTDCMRECIDPEGWIKLWEEEATDLLHHSHWVLVDDLRFTNEVEAVSRLGGVLIKVTRPGYYYRRRRWWQFWRPRPHASEVELSDEMFHMVIDNDGTLDELDELAGKLADLLKHYLPEPTSCSTSA